MNEVKVEMSSWFGSAMAEDVEASTGVADWKLSQAQGSPYDVLFSRSSMVSHGDIHVRTS